MLLRLFRPFILSIQNNQNHNQRCESHAGSHPAIGGNSGRQITEEAARRYAQHIRDLGRYVVDVVALGARPTQGWSYPRSGKHGSPQTAPARIEAVTIVRLFIFSAPTTANAIGSRIPKVPPGRTGRERQPRRDDEHQAGIREPTSALPPTTSLT